MTVRARAINCTQCGAPVEVRNAFKAKTAVCGSCGAQLDLSRPGLEVLGTIDRHRHEARGFVALGLVGTFGGKRYEVIGRLRFEDRDVTESWHWDEWLLLGDDGSYAWLEEDEGEHVFMEPVPASADEGLPGLAEAAPGRVVRAFGQGWRVDEHGYPRIVHLEGELTWRAVVGDSVEYVDAVHGHEVLVCEKTSTEVEFFRGRKLSVDEVLEAFGHAELLDVRRRWNAHREGAWRARQDGIFAPLAFVMAAIFAFVLWFGGDQVVGSTVTEGSPVSVTAVQLTDGIAIGALDLAPAVPGAWELVVSADSAGAERIDVGLARDGAKVPLVSFAKVAGATDPEPASRRVRFQVAGEGRYDLVVSGLPGPNQATGTVSWKLVRRPIAASWLAWGGGALLVAALGAVVIAVLQALRALDQGDVFQAEFAEALEHVHARARGDLVEEVS